MGGNFAGGGSVDTSDSGSTRWDSSVKYTKDSPLIFWPLVIILFVAIGRIVTTDPLIDTLLSMVTVTAFGTQWIGLVRYRHRMNENHWQFDNEQIAKMIELNNKSTKVDMPPSVTFFGSYVPKGIRKIWYRITKKRMLCLYSLGSDRSSSFTKYIVSEKDWFYLQLGGYIGTSDPVLLRQGMEYLKDHKRISSIL